VGKKFIKQLKEREEVREELNFDLDIAKFTERQLSALDHLDSGLIKFLLYGGALGGGKSYFLRWCAVRLLMRYFYKYGVRYVQVMLACEDYPSLKDRQISKMAREFPAWLGKMYVDHKEYGRCFVLNPDYGSGVVCLRNLDDPSKYQSAEFAAILVDELTKNDLQTFTDLRMRIRWAGVPDMACVFIGATNPGGPGHAFCKALWMDHLFPPEFKHPIDYTKCFAYVPSKAEDNPHLDSAYWAQLQTLPPHLRAAFRDGSWDLFKGQAFQEWKRDFHVIEPLYFRHLDGKVRLYPEGAPLFMTFDWGFGAPFSVGWWWVDPEGRKYRFAEWYGFTGAPNMGLRLPDPVIAKGIIQREAGMGLTTVIEQSEFGGFDEPSEVRAYAKVVNPQITRICDPTCFNKKPDYKGGGQMPSTASEFLAEGLILRPGDPSRSLKLRQFHDHLAIPIDYLDPYAVKLGLTPYEDEVFGHYWLDAEMNAVNHEQLFSLARQKDIQIPYAAPMVQIYSTCEQFIRTIPALVQDENNIEDIDTDGEDHCFDSETEILSENGWKYFKDLEKGEKVATLDAGGLVEYQEPQRYINRHFIGDLYAYEGRVNIMVTNGHRLPIVSKHYRRKHWNSWAHKRVDEIKDDCYLPRIGRWQGESPDAVIRMTMEENGNSNQVEAIPLNAFLKYYGFWLAEGCVGKGSGTHYSVHVDQKADVEEIISALGYRYHIVETAPGIKRYSIQSKQFYQYMIGLSCGEDSRNKHIPRWMLLLPKENLRFIYDGMMQGDGSVSNGMPVYNTTSERLAGDFQELLFKLGMVGNIKKYEQKHEYILERKIKSKVPYYRIHVLKHDHSMLVKHKWQKVSYNGSVHCVSVPNETLYVRRNGTPYWSSNCYDEACHIMMHRPVKSYAIQAPVRRPPKAMNEVARLELKQIKEDAQRAFEAEMMGVFNDW